MVLVMADLVGQDAHDLFGRELLLECVVEHHALLAAEAREVGVRLAAALRRVDDENVVEPEAHPVGEGLDGVAQLPFREGRLLVEERHDELRIKVLHEQRKERHRTPGDQPEPTGRERVDPYAERQHGAQDQQVHQQALDGIGHEQFGRRAIEAETLLDDEGPVQVERDRDYPGDQVEDAPEHERLHHRRSADAAGGGVETGESAEGENGQRDQGTDQSGYQGKLAIGHRIGLLLTVLRFIV